MEFQTMQAYNQYSKVGFMRIFFDRLNNYISANYGAISDDLLDAIDIQSSENGYLFYYIANYLGTLAPFVGSSISNLYDTGLLYDNGEVWDYETDGTQLVSFSQVQAFLQFIYNYDSECLNMFDLIKFACAWCEIEPTEIELDYSDAQTIVIKLPQLEACTLFVTMVKIEWNNLGLPFGNIEGAKPPIDFVVSIS